MAVDPALNHVVKETRLTEQGLGGRKEPMLARVLGGTTR